MLRSVRAAWPRSPFVVVLAIGLGAFGALGALGACGGPKPPPCNPVAQPWTPALGATPTVASSSSAAAPASSPSASP